MKNTSVILKEEQLEWLTDQVRLGRFASIGHGIRYALDKFIEREGKEGKLEV